MAKTAKKTESGIFGTVREAAAGLHRAGVIDKATMREFDALCLTVIRPDQAQRKVARRAR
jgi:putative transcriptional regulator